MSWRFYATKELKPRGWLKRQLEIQAEGLNGNLDKVWRDVRDSAWIGGEAEGWERVPYWLDGFIPLAYLLDDPDMITRAQKYINAIIANQKPSGWICPCSEDEIQSYDTWAVQLISKLLTVYYHCSGDERVPEVLYRVMKNYYELLSSGQIRLFDWGKYRWFEAFIAIEFLQERYDAPWLTELGRILKEQGADYSTLIQRWKRPLNAWSQDTHVVNLAMMLKSEAVTAGILGEPYTDLAEKLYQQLCQYNGTPVGTFTGDECLSGLSPIQGTELCAVVELMYSFELLYACTGDAKWAERLEKVAFNALPAAISDDMWAHQYVQMSNQISCERFPGRSVFRTNNHEAHLFGLEPCFGCCTANFGQGWPKLALSAFLHQGNTVLSAVPVPAELKTEAFTVCLDTDYPFKNELHYEIHAREDMYLQIRIPSFAQNVCVNGQPVEKTDSLSFAFRGGSDGTVSISFETAPRLVDRPHGLRSVQMGSLVFSVPIRYEKIPYEYVKDNVERKAPYCDYEYRGVSEWRYGYVDKQMDICRNPVGQIPFSSQQPPVYLKAAVKQIPWELEDGFETVCAKLPGTAEPTGPEETILLYPYGCAKLRMTELPLVK